MIQFKSVKWKNFLSTGNEFISIELDRTPSTLIVGQNGAGKSTLLDALSFGLFGKAHRDIKKDQLINSINKKQTIVEVYFNIGGQEFKIVRGIRPGKFEIWQNDRQINQASNARDHQKFLEQNILKLNHKSFHQIVVLGSSSFIPFMQLPAWSRRDVIEDLLDINVFSKMNQLLKERNATIRNNLIDIDHNLDLVKTKMTSQEKYIKDLSAINKDQMDQKKESIEEHSSNIKGIFKESKELGNNLAASLKSEQTNYEKQVEQISNYKSHDQQLNNKVKSLVQEAKFYEENDECPTCDQPIEESKKTTKIAAIKRDAAGIQQEKEDLDRKLSILSTTTKSINQSIEKLRQRQNKINSNNDQITLLQKEIDKIQKEINSWSDRRY